MIALKQIKPVILLTLFALVGVVVISFIETNTSERAQANQQAHSAKQLQNVLQQVSYNNEPWKESLEIDQQQESTKIILSYPVTRDGAQVATVGVNELTPNLVNVIAKRALVTVDLRNIEENLLQAAEQELSNFIESVAAEEGITVTKRKLARFNPVIFNPHLVSQVEQTALALGLSCKKMPSGAGHDAQMFAPNCPAAMIFVPSEKGISHNVAEYTPPHQLEAGANVLLQVLLDQAL